MVFVEANGHCVFFCFFYLKEHDRPDGQSTGHYDVYDDGG